MEKKTEKTSRQSVVRTCMVVIDVLFVLFATIGTQWLLYRRSEPVFPVLTPIVFWALANVLLAVGLFFLFRIYFVVYTSVGFPEALRILLTAAIVCVVNMLFVWLCDGQRFGIGFAGAGVYSLLFLCGTIALRFSKRICAVCKTQILNLFTKKTKVMIVGYNSDAFTLIRTIATDKMGRYKVVCIVDDEALYLGKRIYDVRVVGSTFEAKEVVKKYGVQEIFVALPSVSKKTQSEVLHRLKECKLPLRLLPELSAMTHGEISVSKLRQVAITDLLGREQVSVNLSEVIGYIENKTILVLGGGGSIGSELCRQVAMHKPEKLIILDIYENNLYDIEQELLRRYPDLPVLSLVASIRDEKKIWEIFERYRPQIVFNAAAHKHVPLMETSPNEAVKNNVFGTLNVAKAADEFEVETFVQISTDKAVNPTNIMGATKRICEMIIQSIGRHSKKTKFVAVRFGNVLGSNGSVVPLFKKQIEEGGPITITHKDIIRYFMTIPEAVSLVLQAGAYAIGGQIFVLDMGEPVRIYDLAYNLIKLSGLEPEVDVEIRCTGLRPGEKLYEERLIAEEGLQKTDNGLISIAQPIPFDEESFWTAMQRLHAASQEESEEIKDWVKEIVPTYTIDRRQSPAAAFVATESKKAE